MKLTLNAKELDHIDFTVPQALAIRRNQLVRWRSKLSAECYLDLVAYLKAHAKTHEYKTGYDVPRGTDLTGFIENWRWEGE